MGGLLPTVSARPRGHTSTIRQVGSPRHRQRPDSTLTISAHGRRSDTIEVCGVASCGHGLGWMEGDRWWAHRWPARPGGRWRGRHDGRDDRWPGRDRAVRRPAAAAAACGRPLAGGAGRARRAERRRHCRLRARAPRGAARGHARAPGRRPGARPRGADRVHCRRPTGHRGAYGAAPVCDRAAAPADPVDRPRARGGGGAAPAAAGGDAPADVDRPGRGG